MKRWWNISRRTAPGCETDHRVRRILMRAAMAGAVSFPIPSHSSGIAIRRTRGAVSEAWAFGTLSAARQPNSEAACDLSHVCALAISSAGGAGTGTGATIKTSFETPSQGELPPNLPFVLTETIDYAHPVTNAAHGGNSELTRLKRDNPERRIRSRWRVLSREWSDGDRR
jgi:hypothetical protein